MSEIYLRTIEEMENELKRRYGEIPKGNLMAYEWLMEQAGVNSTKIPYEERYHRHEGICKILGIPSQGGIAGRDVDEF